MREKCRDFMTADPRWIPASASALDAARMMRDHAVGFLPVCDTRTERLVAVVTDRDLVTRMCAADGLPSDTPVTRLATHNPISCGQDADLRVAVAAMRRFHLTRLVVVDEDARPVGVLSRTDLARARHEIGAQDAARAREPRAATAELT